jgi:hypothetical protein
VACFRARGARSRRVRRGLGGGLAAVAVACGALLLIAAEPLELRGLRAGGRAVAGGSLTAGAHHGYALALLGAALLVLGSVAVWRGSPVAAWAALAVAVAAAFVVAAIDAPALDDTGLVGPARTLARAHAGPAWRVELIGAVLALAGTGGLVALTHLGRRRTAAG